MQKMRRTCGSPSQLAYRSYGFQTTYDKNCCAVDANTGLDVYIFQCLTGLPLRDRLRGCLNGSLIGGCWDVMCIDAVPENMKPSILRKQQQKYSVGFDDSSALGRQTNIVRQCWACCSNVQHTTRMPSMSAQTKGSRSLT